jgi:predicted Rossmann fold nucleotide-binding protein DprA/Smf involved in DNA uptake
MTVQELRDRAAKLMQAADLIEAAMGAPKTKPAKLLVVKGSRASGTEAVVLASIRDGHSKLAEIAKDSKLRESAARTAVLKLEQRGSVKREGKGSLTRYIAA